MLTGLLVPSWHHEHQSDARSHNQQAAYPVGGAQSLAEDRETPESGNDDCNVRERADIGCLGLLISEGDADLAPSGSDAEIPSATRLLNRGQSSGPLAPLTSLST